MFTKFDKATIGIVASGAATFVGAALGWDAELIAAATAFLTGIAVWLVPNVE